MPTKSKNLHFLLTMTVSDEHLNRAVLACGAETRPNTMTSFTNFICELNSEEKCTNYLLEKGVLKNSMKCPKCGKELTMIRDSLLFHCHNTFYVTRIKKKKMKIQCNFKQSAKVHTFFANAHITLVKAVRFIAEWLWLSPPRFEFITDDLNMGTNTIVNWSSFCREVCVNWLANNSSKIGGPGKIVEVGEAKFGKRKHERGRLLKGKWVFGGYERGTKKVFVVGVENRGAEILLNVIKQWIIPGTTIVSDCWKGYNCLKDEGYLHLKANHTYNFVNPNTGANTQAIERLWSDERPNIAKYFNREEDLASYFAEYLFKRCYTRPERIDTFFKEIVTFQEILYASDDANTLTESQEFANV